MVFGLDDLKKIGQTFYNAGKMKEYQAILEAQQRIFDLQEENADLKDKNKQFKDYDKFEKSLVFEKNAFYSVNKDGDKIGPYCPKCWGDEKKELRMQKGKRFYHCPKCGSTSDL
jgi:hypothetical protein